MLQNDTSTRPLRAEHALIHFQDVACAQKYAWMPRILVLSSVVAHDFHAKSPGLDLPIATVLYCPFGRTMRVGIQPPPLRGPGLGRVVGIVVFGMVFRPSGLSYATAGSSKKAHSSIAGRIDRGTKGRVTALGSISGEVGGVSQSAPEARVAIRIRRSGISGCGRNIEVGGLHTDQYIHEALSHPRLHVPSMRTTGETPACWVVSPR